MSAFEIRPRSTTEIVDAAFELMRRDYLTLITITAAIQLPILVLQIFLGMDLSSAAKIVENLGAFIFLSVLSLVALSLSDAAIIVAVSDMYLGRRADVGRALGQMLSRIVPLILSSIVRVVASYFFIFFFVVPGVYVYSRLTALPAVVVLEDGDTGSSISRAWKLGGEKVGDIFMTLLLGFIIYWALTFVFTFGLQFLASLVPFFAQPNVSMAIQRLPGVFFYPIISIITTLIYYDLRVRKEAFDLEMMAKELGAPAA